MEECITDERILVTASSTEQLLVHTYRPLAGRTEFYTKIVKDLSDDALIACNSLNIVSSEVAESRTTQMGKISSGI
jgi:hypothetical protein